MREWAIQNAEQWVRDYHVDGLRLDAVHAIVDDRRTTSARSLAERVHAFNPRPLVISEMEVDNWRPIDEWGHDAQWADRSHHELQCCSRASRDGYYAGYGRSRARARPAGQGHDPRRLVICAQNHDQVGTAQSATGCRRMRSESRPP